MAKTKNKNGEVPAARSKRKQPAESQPRWRRRYGLRDLPGRSQEARTNNRATGRGKPTPAGDVSPLAAVPEAEEVEDGASSLQPAIPIPDVPRPGSSSDLKGQSATQHAGAAAGDDGADLLGDLLQVLDDKLPDPPTSDAPADAGARRSDAVFEKNIGGRKDRGQPAPQGLVPGRKQDQPNSSKVNAGKHLGSSGGDDSRKRKGHNNEGGPLSPKKRKPQQPHQRSGQDDLKVPSQRSGPSNNAADRSPAHNDVAAGAVANKPAVGESKSDDITQVIQDLCDKDIGFMIWYADAMVEAAKEPIITSMEVREVIGNLLAAPGPPVNWARTPPIRDVIRERVRQKEPSQADQGLGERQRQPANLQIADPTPAEQSQPRPHLTQFPPIPVDKSAAARALGWGAGGHWNFLATVGQGGMGHAGLWVQVDPTGRITNRLVAKETYQDLPAWSDPVFWYSIREEDRLPWEARTHVEVSRLKSSWSVVRYNTWQLYREQKMYRIYMAYCPLGSLQDLIRQHISRQGFLGTDGKPVDSHIPEPMIWSVFESLVTSACLMRDGGEPDEDIPVTWVEQIVHRDIKPHNIFLSRPSDQDTRWPGLPRSELGDFGLAIYESVPGIDNPYQLIGMGTAGFMAPEQFVYEDNTEYLGKHRLNSSTDIFAIGKTILMMMELSWPAQSRFDQAASPGMSPSCNRYSQDLRSLVEQCLRRDPDTRISADTLFEEIKSKIENNGPGDEEDQYNIPYMFRKLKEEEQIFPKQDIYQQLTRE